MWTIQFSESAARLEHLQCNGLYQGNSLDIHIFYMYVICMTNMYITQPTLKPVTLYMLTKLYETYQIEAQKKGKKASELIRDAMEDYAQRNFYHKKSMAELKFNPYSWDLFKVNNKNFTNEIIAFIDENMEFNNKKKETKKSEEQEKAMNDLKNIFNMN